MAVFAAYQLEGNFRKDERKRKMKILNKLFSALICVLNDKSGEFKYTIADREITATFTDEPNKRIVRLLKSIILGESHIRQNKETNITIKENNEE